MEIEKFNFTVPLHKACANDDLRPAFSHVYFIDGYAYASDAHILVEHSIDDYCFVIGKEFLNGHSLHRDSFQNIMKFDKAEANEEGVECWDEGGKKAFFPYSQSDWDASKFKQIFKQVSPEPTQMFGIEPRYFAIADKVLPHGTSPIKVTLSGMDKAMLLTCADYPNQRVLIMPSMIDQTIF